jgi:hypothetical protein
MTDRELLELAAKAAGISHPEGIEWVNNDLGFQWNPLTDDGDALRLAVTLQMAINITPSKVFAGDGHTGHTEVMDSAAPYAATRRAIVRAAAEIGKEMK